VHTLPSLQGFTLFVWEHPVAGSHESVVQTLPSLQFTGVPEHTPFAHVSAVVQALPSLQVAVPFVWTQLPAGLHVSSVQGLPSSQYAAGRPRHESEGIGENRTASGTELGSTLAAISSLVAHAGASKRVPPSTVMPSASMGARTGLIR
jgi:hypothetical protein